MEYRTTTPIQVAKDMGFVMCNESSPAMKTACPQQRGHLGRSLLHHFVHGHVHGELCVDPYAQQLEGITVIVPSVNDCKLLLGAVEDGLVGTAPDMSC